MVVTVVPQPEQVRLFVAVRVPDSFKDQVRRAQAHLQHRQIIQATYPQESAMHLTLAFLGGVSTDQVEPIKQALSTVRFVRLQLHLGGVHFFGPAYAPQVLFLHVTGTGLPELVHAIEQALAPWMRACERAFVGHLTIARIKRVNDQEALERFLTSFSCRMSPFELDQFVLVQSELFPEGPQYTQVACFKAHAD